MYVEISAGRLSCHRYILREVILERRSRSRAIQSVHKVLYRARPFDEYILFPGGVLNRKAERKPSGVNSNRDANDGIP